jgi:hypothetical protein
MIPGPPHPAQRGAISPVQRLLDVCELPGILDHFFLERAHGMEPCAEPGEGASVFTIARTFGHCPDSTGHTPA